MFVRNKVFSQRRLLRRCKILFYKPYVYFIDDEEFLVLSDLFEWKDLCFRYEGYSTFNLNDTDRVRDLEKETFRCDSCFPYKVHFLYIKDIWFAWPKYGQINLSLTSSLGRPAQLSVVFEVNTIHQSNFQSTSLVRRKKKRYLDLRGEKIQSPWKIA